MKIIVTHSREKNKQWYLVEVVEGDRSIYKEEVHSVKKRDEIVWKLADLYGAVDIEIVEEDPKEFMFSEIPTIPVLDEEEAEEYFEDNQEFVYERILQAVQEALMTDRDSIRLFELNGTGIYITSEKKNWKSGLDQALKYFIVVEAYEQCIIIKQLLNKLNKV